MGGQTLVISGDKAKIEVDNATNMGIKPSIQEFLILEQDTEPLVIGVQGRWLGKIAAIRPDWSIWTLLVLLWQIRWMKSKIKLRKTQS